MVLVLELELVLVLLFVFELVFGLSSPFGSSSGIGVPALATVTTREDFESSEIQLNQGTENKSLIMRCLLNDRYPVGCFVWKNTTWSPI